MRKEPRVPWVSFFLLQALSGAWGHPEHLPLIHDAYNERLCEASRKSHTPLRSRSTCILSRISGNAASDKNIKDGVCAQIEKNFARAKWKVRIQLAHFLELNPSVPVTPRLLCLYCTPIVTQLCLALRHG